jgi:hypothetical protein
VAELRGKGWRVLGYFLWMLGAGVVLDSDAVWSGSGLLICGFLLFMVGVTQSRRQRPNGGGTLS